MLNGSHQSTTVSFQLLHSHIVSIEQFPWIIIAISTMWSVLLLVSLAVAGGTVQFEGPWNPNTEYTYQIYSKTYAGIPALRQQYAAVVSQGQLVFQARNSSHSNVLVGHLANYEHASYNGDSSSPSHQHHGWMHMEELHYKSSSLNGKAFEVQLAAGTVQNVQVDASMTNDEVNQLKAILSALQVDYQGQNLIGSVHNQLPTESGANNAPSGFYYTMEPSITGQCQVTYEVSPLAAYTAPHAYPHWAESVAATSAREESFFQIVKTTDYNNCATVRGFHHGLSGWNDKYNTQSNHIGDVLSRSTVSQIVASGSPADFAIQYVQTTMRVSAAPELIQKQTTLTTGNIELVLTSMHEYNSQMAGPTNPQNVGNLVYRYDIPSDVKNQARTGHNSPYQGAGGASSGYESQYQGAGGASSGYGYQGAGGASSGYGYESQYQGASGASSGYGYGPHSSSYQGSAGASSGYGYGPHSSSYQGSAGASSGYGYGPNPYAYPGNSIGRHPSANAQSSYYDHYWQPVAGMHEAPQHPFLPYSVGHQGHAIYHKVDMAPQMKIMAVYIDEALANVDSIPHRNILQEYNILTKLVAAASLEDIQEAAQAVQKLSAVSTSAGPWGVFRDAVAVAGTGPASQFIVQAIADGYIAGNEAIAVLVVQPKVVDTPTSDFVNAYLKMIKSEKVAQQSNVYWTALLTLAEIIGRSYSDQRYAQNFYPVDSYGHFNQNLTNVVYNQVIPYYTQQLEQAFAANNERNILSSIRAYGNLGHASYLTVFKKYYENSQVASPFQRAALVQALDYLAVSHAHLIHPILYKIYQNVAEHPDVRSVAVLRLIFTNPSSATWQEVASFTHQDPSVQVQSIVKNAIDNFAGLEHAEYEEAAQRARAAQPLLSAQAQHNGNAHSAIYQHFVDNLNYNRYDEMSTRSSGYSGFPKYFGVRSFTNAGGLYKSSGYFANAVSNVRELFAHFTRPWQTAEQANGKVETIVTEPKNFILENVPLPADAEELVQHLQNIVYFKAQPLYSASGASDNNGAKKSASPRSWHEPHGHSHTARGSAAHSQDSLQGQFQFPYFGGQRYHAFDRTSVENLPATIQNVLNNYKDGRSVSFTKFYKDDTVTIAFPLVTGYPYVYTWDSPVLVHVQGTVQVQASQPVHQHVSHMFNIPTALNLTTAIKFTYSRDHITQAGFVTPFSGQHYVAGHVRKVMYNVPLNVNVNVDLVRGSINGAVSPPEQFTVGHFSSWPYTAFKDAFSVTPDTSQSSGAKLIHARPMKYVNREAGRNGTGLVFHFSGKYETPRDIQGPIPYLVGGVPQSNFVQAFSDPSEGVEAYKIDVKYDQQNSQADGIRFGFATKSGVIRNGRPQGSSGSGHSNSGGYSNNGGHSNSGGYSNNGGYSNSGSSSSSGGYSNNGGHSNNGGYSNSGSSSSSGGYSNSGSSSGGHSNSGSYSNYGGYANSGAYSNSGSYSSSPQSGADFQQSIDELFERLAPSQIANGHSTVVQGWVALVGYGHQSVYQGFGAYTTSRPEGIYRVSAGFRKNEHVYFNAKEYCVDMSVARSGNQQYASSSMSNALDTNPDVAIQLRLTVGNDCIQGQHNPNNTNLIGVGVMNQTADYVNYALHSVEAQQCKYDSKQGNYQTPACRWTIRQLRLPNTLQFNMKAVGSDQYLPDLLDFIAYTQDNEIVRDHIRSQQSLESVSGEVSLSPDSHYYDGTVQYGDQEFDIHDYQTGPIVRSVIFNQHPFGFGAFKSRDAECVIDRNFITTFDQSIVDRSVGRCLYVAAQRIDPIHAWTKPSQVRNVNVIIGDKYGSQRQYNREVGIQFYTDANNQSYFLEIHGKGEGVRPLITLWSGEQARHIPNDKHTEVVADGVVRIHVHPQTEQADNVVVVDVHDASMRVSFNGETLRIQADASYEQRVRGLCGNNDLEPFNDQQSPQHCIYRDQTQFVESWAIHTAPAGYCESGVVQIQKSLDASVCHPIEYIPDVVVNEYEAEIGLHNFQSHGSKRASSSSPSSCTVRHQIQEVSPSSGVTCFSAEALPACPQNCQSVGQKRQSLPVKCYNSQDPMVRLHKQSVAKGQTKLKWGQNAVSRSQNFNVPSSCASSGSGGSQSYQE